MGSTTIDLERPTQYFQKGLGLKQHGKDQLAANYHSRIIDYLRQHDFTVHLGTMQIFLAKEFGFCYGVERAVEYAYQARERFPERRIFLTGEIIHNPHVNQRMLDMGIGFLTGRYSNGNGYDSLQPDDVVIVPAFGVTVAEFKRLANLGCIVVDTTCGSVLNVWKRVEHYAKDGFTSVIHGKYNHEETLATSSQCLKYDGGHYLVVRDMDEAELACDFIHGKYTAAELLSRFSQAISPGFDPNSHLQRIGLANQTTMLSSESLAIAERLKQAMIKKYGAGEISHHFRTFDTICSATQERQDAVLELVKKQKLDLMLVIGGYNSSNTTHLVEISSQHTAAYHIENATCLESRKVIRCKPFDQQQEVSRYDWLPLGRLKIGLTAGASTPNNKIAEVIARLADLQGLHLEDWLV